MQICLATGQVESVLVTAQGDTLIGNARVNIDDLRPGVVFAGVYAEGADWYENDELVQYREPELRTVRATKLGSRAATSCAWASTTAYRCSRIAARRRRTTGSMYRCGRACGSRTRQGLARTRGDSDF